MKHGKRLLSFLLAVCIVLGCVPVQAQAAQMPYTDLKKGAYYEEAVQYAYDNGLMNGVSATKFAPNDVTTRAMVVTVLYRMEGEPEAEGTLFEDMRPGAYYEKAVLWAQANGIVKGYDDKHFGPDDTVTREQIATIVYRYAKYKGYTTYDRTDLSDFTDGKEVSNFAKDAFSWAVAIGLINGVGNHLLDCKGSATRGQIATILWRFLLMFSKKVVFDLQIDGILGEQDLSEYGIQLVSPGETVDKPADPKPIFGKFLGWYTSDTYGTLYDFTKEVHYDTTLYAHWEFDKTDTDGDRIIDEAERYLGTDPGLTDTDGDGLSDYMDLYINLNPLKPDTDGDGISDFDEDADGDGLTNGEEVEHGSDPIYEDTDLDWLTDYEEIMELGTHPDDTDSDNDGATDSWEQERGFDPLTLNSTFLVQVEPDPVGPAHTVSAGVEVELKGRYVESLKVEPVSVVDNPLMSASIAGYLGSAYEFSCDGSFETATMTFTYDTELGTIGEDFQPRIYCFNEDIGVFEELPNQTVTEGKVSAEVTHFSTYILLNKVWFMGAWQTEIRRPMISEDGRDPGVDIVFVIDASPSMEGEKMELAQEAISQFLLNMELQDRAALVSFNWYAQTHSELTFNKEDVQAKLDDIVIDLFTTIPLGLNRALDIFSNDKQAHGYQMIILLTDGNDAYSTDSEYQSILNKAINNGVTIHTIGVGEDVNEALLTRLSYGTGGEYFLAEYADEIQTNLDMIHVQIDHEMADLPEDFLTDSNDDGISDYFAKLLYTGELPLNNGSLMLKGYDLNKDMNGNPSADYDGDGLLNGEEISVGTYSQYDPETGKYYKRVIAFYNSDPLVNESTTSKSDYEISKLFNDYYYDYETVVNDFDKNFLHSFFSTAGGFLTGATPPKEQMTSQLINYFSDYGEAAVEIEQAQQDIARDTLLINLDRIQAAATKHFDNLTDLADLNGDATDLKNVLMKSEAVLDEKGIEYFQEVYGRFITLLDDYNAPIPEFITESKKLGPNAMRTIEYVDLDPKAYDVDGLGLSIATDAVSGVLDIWSTVNTFSRIKANSVIFEQNLDFIVQMRNHGDRDVVRQAADAVFEAIGEGYWDSVAKAVGSDVLQMAGSIAVSIASCNPYVAAVSFALSAIDALTGFSGSVDCEVQMLCYNSMVDSLEELTGREYRATNQGDGIVAWRVNRYLIHAAQVRILGEKVLLEYRINGLPALGRDEEETRKEVAQSIADIRKIAAELNITLHPKLQ